MTVSHAREQQVLWCSALVNDACSPLIVERRQQCGTGVTGAGGSAHWCTPRGRVARATGAAAAVRRGPRAALCALVDPRRAQVEAQLVSKAGAVAHRTDEADFYKRKARASPRPLRSVASSQPTGAGDAPPHRGVPARPCADCVPAGGRDARDGPVQRALPEAQGGPRVQGAPRASTGRSLEARACAARHRPRLRP